MEQQKKSDQELLSFGDVEFPNPFVEETPSSILVVGTSIEEQRQLLQGQGQQLGQQIMQGQGGQGQVQGLVQQFQGQGQGMLMQGQYNREDWMYVGQNEVRDTSGGLQMMQMQQQPQQQQQLRLGEQMFVGQQGQQQKLQFSGSASGNQLGDEGRMGEFSLTRQQQQQGLGMEKQGEFFSTTTQYSLSSSSNQPVPNQQNLSQYSSGQFSSSNQQQKKQIRRGVKKHSSTTSSSTHALDLIQHGQPNLNQHGLIQAHGLNQQNQSQLFQEPGLSLGHGRNRPDSFSSSQPQLLQVSSGSQSEINQGQSNYQQQGGFQKGPEGDLSFGIQQSQTSLGHLQPFRFDQINQIFDQPNLNQPGLPQSSFSQPNFENTNTNTSSLFDGSKSNLGSSEQTKLILASLIQSSTDLSKLQYQSSNLDQATGPHLLHGGLNQVNLRLPENSFEQSSLVRAAGPAQSSSLTQPSRDQVELYKTSHGHLKFQQKNMLPNGGIMPAPVVLSLTKPGKSPAKGAVLPPTASSILSTSAAAMTTTTTKTKKKPTKSQEKEKKASKKQEGEATVKLRSACDYCTNSKIKCTCPDGPPCKSCAKNGLTCIFSQQRKRGPRPMTDEERKRARQKTEN